MPPSMRRHAGFQHGVGGVHDAAVDVACHLQVKQVSAVLGVVKRVSHGLVNRHSHRFGGGVGRVATVYGNGFDFHGFFCPVLKSDGSVILDRSLLDAD
jgi:hypothetical protein